jgi:hypothetical protein
METQHFKTNRERIHFTQTMLKEHPWEWWMSQKQETPELLETLSWEEFKLWLDGRFMSQKLGALKWVGVIGSHPKGQRGLVDHLRLRL